MLIFNPEQSRALGSGAVVKDKFSITTFIGWYKSKILL